MAYSILLHIHSGLRWIVLLIIIFALINAWLKYRKQSVTTTLDLAFNRFALIFTHLQIIVGLVLYFISPKVVFDGASMKEPLLRFFLVEHIALMLIAIVLITLGFVKSKKAVQKMAKHKMILVYYGIGLLLILLSIPWPFRNLGAGWF